MIELRKHYLALAPLMLSAAPATPAEVADPLRFFAGRTETQGMVKVVFKKPYRSRSFGLGRIEADGSLTLVQRVQDDGKPARERRWRVRQVSPGHYTGSMSEASGPVDIRRVGDRYVFRFKMKGNLNAEQWLSPTPDAAVAHTTTKVRKFGMTVATTEGTVRKLGGS
ncbi:MAG TPA: DUF3833 family protein [Sphingomicrobium sp.]|nr:DUF3833 family protein [Sphingomicrobium sp.]